MSDTELDVSHRPHVRMTTPVGVQALAKEWWGMSLMQGQATDISDLFVSSGQLRRTRKDEQNGYLITGDGIFAWLKNRLLERGAFRCDGCEPQDTQHASATLHIGFVFIKETPAMVESLREEQVVAGRDSTARSRFACVSQVQDVHAVNALAAKVTGVRPSK